jgi:large-conductance mechanosensitive channel
MNMDKTELVDFIVNNNLMTYSAGVVIGLVSKDLILSLVQDIVIPGILLLFIKLKFDFMTKILPHKDKKVQINYINFIGCVITWILALFCTFIFVQYTFVKFLGIKKDAKKDSNSAPAKSDTSQSVEPEGYR